MIHTIFDNVQKKTPLVHCITNYVTVNDCANMILASGGSPIMADDIREAADITSICSALVINMGTLNERTVQSMVAAGKQANALNHPVIFDPVGAGASPFRNETALMLLKEVRCTVIRGNISEIKFLASGDGSTQGVDAAEADKVTAGNLDSVTSFAKALARKTGAVIAITGATDIVADRERAWVITNGHPMMSRITGTGCMLTALLGAYIGANPKNPLDAAAAAVCLMGLSGEIAFAKTEQTGGGTGSFRTYLVDAVSCMTAKQLKEGAKIAGK